MRLRVTEEYKEAPWRAEVLAIIIQFLTFVFFCGVVYKTISDLGDEINKEHAARVKYEYIQAAQHDEILSLKFELKSLRKELEDMKKVKVR